MAASELVFRLIGIDAGATRTVERLGVAAGRTAKQLETIGASSATTGAKAATVFNKVGKASALMAGVVVAAGVKMAGDFEQQTNVLVTAAGELPKNLAHIRDGILNISTETGTAWQKVVESVYDAEKAGFRNDDALKISTAAAQAAREENADLSTVTDGLTRALVAYNKTGKDAVQVTNALKTGAGSAHATFEEYSAGLGSFLSRAANAKISLPDALGVYSSLTQQESAQQAGQNLGSTIGRLAALNGPQQKIFGQLGLNVVDFQNKLGDGPGGRGLIGSLNLLSETALKFMGGPAKGLLSTFNSSQLAAKAADTEFAALPPAAQKVAKGFRDGALSFTDFRKQARGLPGQLSTLALQWYATYKNAHGFQDVLKQGGPLAQNYLGLMKKLTGGQEGLTVALAASGMQAGATDSRVKAIGKSYRDTTKDVEGWKSTQKLFNVQFDQFKQTAERVAIEIGTQLLPPLKKLFGFLADHKGVLKAVADGVLLFGSAWAGMKFASFIGNLATMARRIAGVGAAATVSAGEVNALATAEARAAGAGTAAAGAGAAGGVGAAEAGAAGAAAGRASRASRFKAGALKLIIPVAISYVVLDELGLTKTLDDLVHGDLHKALNDAPKWGKEWGASWSRAFNGPLTGEIADPDPIKVAFGTWRKQVQDDMAKTSEKIFELKLSGQGDSPLVKQLEARLGTDKTKLDALGIQEGQAYVNGYLKALAGSKNLFDKVFPGAADKSREATKQAALRGQADPQAAYLKAMAGRKALFDKIFPDADKVKGFQDSLANINVLLDKNNKSLVGDSGAAQTNRQAITLLADQAKAAATQYAKTTGNQDDYRRSLDLAIPAIEAAATATGLDKGQVDGLLRSLGLMPPQKETKVSAPGAAQANAELASFLNMLSQIPPAVQTQVITYYKSIGTPNETTLASPAAGYSGPTHFDGSGRAMGGLAKGWTLVGERGPEMIHLGSSSMVMNHRDSMNALGVGGGGTVNNFYITALDPKSFRDYVNNPQNADAISTALARRRRP